MIYNYDSILKFDTQRIFKEKKSIKFVYCAFLKLSIDCTMYMHFVALIVLIAIIFFTLYYWMVHLHFHEGHFLFFLFKISVCYGRLNDLLSVNGKLLIFCRGQVYYICCLLLYIKPQMIGCTKRNFLFTVCYQMHTSI